MADLIINHEYYIELNHLVNDISVIARKNWLEQLEVPTGQRIYFRQMWVRDVDLMEALNASLRT